MQSVRANPDKRRERNQQIIGDAARCALETLEQRVLMSDIQWTNRGTGPMDDTDNFNAVYGANANVARAIVDRAIGDWERVIVNFNRSGGDNTFELDIEAQVFGGGLRGQTSGIGSSDGIPENADIDLDDDGGDAGWYFDPVIGTSVFPDDGEFNGFVTAFAANGGGAGFDFYRTALHEIGHAMGITQQGSLRLDDFLTNAGTDPVDGTSTLWSFNVGGGAIEATFTDVGGLHFFEGPAPAGLTAHPNELLNAGRAVPMQHRRLISDLLATTLQQAYGYTIRLPSQTNTFYANLNTTTDVLTIQGDPGTTADSITIDTLGPGTIRVQVNGTSELFAESDVNSIVVNAGAGNDVINVDFIDSSNTLTINAGTGNDTINFAQSTGHMDNVLGLNLTVNGDGGTDSLRLFDSANTRNDGFTVTSSTVARVFLNVMSYSGMESIRIDAGSGNNTMNVQSLGSATSLQLNAGSGNDTISIGGTLNTVESVDGNVTAAGQLGTDTLNFNDSANPIGDTYTLSSFQVTRTAGPLVSYSAMESIKVNAGSGANTINVNSAAAGSSTTVNAGGGADTVNIGLSAATLLTVNGGDANDIINLNNPGGLSNIVVINGNASTGSGDTLNYNAQNSSANDVYEINSGSIERTGNVDVFHGTFEQVVINAGIGNDRFDVETTATGTTYTINGNTGADVMNVTLSSGNLGNADGMIAFNGDAGSDSVTLWDNLNAASGVYTVTATQATRAGFGGLGYAGVEALVLSASTVNDSINLNSTASGTSYALNGNGGNDGFRIANSTQNLATITSPVNVNGGTGTDSVVLFDNLSNASETTTITATQVTHPGFGAFQYSNLESLVFEGGSGNDIVDVTSTGATTPVTARGNGGDDQFRLAGGNLTALPALVHVEGGTGVNTAVLRDHATVENDAFTVTATQITHPGFGGIIYSDLTTLTVEAGSGNNVFTVNSTSSVTDIRLKGNAGNDFYEVNSTSSFRPVIIDAGSGTTNVINSIPAASAALVIENNQTLQSLTLIGDVRASFAGSGASIVTQFANVLSGARFDLGANALIVDYSGSSPLSAINSLLVSGYNGGAWNGVGINSSAATTSGNTAIGIAEATDLFSTFPVTFAGRSIDNTSILLKHTFYGDTNLDGIVNLTDFNRLAANFGQSSRRWIHGDSDFNGTVNLTDFNRLAGNFGSAGASPNVIGEGDEHLELILA